MNAQQGTLLIVEQMNEVLCQVTPAAYTAPLDIFHGSTVGQHFRHILEFYTCLLEGIETDYVSYGSRRRDDRIAESPAAALAVLEYVAAAAGALNEHGPLNVESEFSDDAGCQAAVYRSSVGRELQYAFDHAVHHLAIIRIGLEMCFPAIPLSADLGVAPSTLKYRKDQNAPVPGEKMDSPASFA